jgi:hypothetical protein
MQLSRRSEITLYLICYLSIGALCTWSIIKTCRIDAINLILVFSFIALSLFPSVSKFKIGGLLEISKRLEEHNKAIDELRLRVNQQVQVGQTAKAEINFDFKDIQKRIKGLNGKADEANLERHAEAAYLSIFPDEIEIKNIFYRIREQLERRLQLLAILKGVTFHGQGAFELAKEMREEGKINLKLYEAIIEILRMEEGELLSDDDLKNTIDLAIAILGVLDLELEKIREFIESKGGRL